MTPAHRLAVRSRLTCDWEAHEFAVVELLRLLERERVIQERLRRREKQRADAKDALRSHWYHGVEDGTERAVLRDEARHLARIVREA